MTTIDGFVRFPAGLALSGINGIVRLENVTLADARSLFLATAVFTAERADRPIPFHLSTGSEIDASQDYILTVEASAIRIDTGQTQKFGTRSAIVWTPDSPASDLTIDIKPWT